MTPVKHIDLNTLAARRRAHEGRLATRRGRLAVADELEAFLAHLHFGVPPTAWADALAVLRGQRPTDLHGPAAAVQVAAIRNARKALRA